jgi:hypothetical protein
VIKPIYACLVISITTHSRPTFDPLRQNKQQLALQILVIKISMGRVCFLGEIWPQTYNFGRARALFYFLLPDGELLLWGKGLEKETHQ